MAAINTSPNSDFCICLIGYRACGKTSIARILAEKLNIQAVDSDVEIEKRANKSIARIFAEEGEQAFRTLETAVLADLLSSGSLILATGGGVPVREENRRLIQRSGVFTVWLTASPETILHRMQGDARNDSTRPPLTNLPAEEEIRTLLIARAPFYQELADLILDTDSAAPAELAGQILQAVKK